jgi:hypothetical protein
MEQAWSELIPPLGEPNTDGIRHVVPRSSLNQLLHSQRKLAQAESEPVIWLQARARQEVLKASTPAVRDKWSELDAALSKFQTGHAKPVAFTAPPPPPDPTSLLLDSLSPTIRPKAKSLLQVLTSTGLDYDDAFRLLLHGRPIAGSNAVDFLCALLRPPPPKAFSNQRAYLSSLMKQTTGFETVLRFLAGSKLPLSSVRNCLVRDFLRQLRMKLL